MILYHYNPSHKTTVDDTTVPQVWFTNSRTYENKKYIVLFKY